MKVSQNVKDKVASLSSQAKVACSVKILSDKKFPVTQQQKMAYILECGISMNEYLEALCIASDGALLKASGVL